MSEQVSSQPHRAPEKTRAEREVVPPVDIFESPQDFLILVDLPGVNVDGINVQLEPPELRLSGRTSETPERTPTVYARSFHVNDGLDPEGVSAELKDGVLRVRLRKSPHLTPRAIPVKVGD